MSLLGSITSLPSDATNQASSQSNDPTQSGASSLQNEFLTMLTTELRNQDPMNPMNSTQMVTQLSQISMTQGISGLEKLSQSQILATMGNQRLESSTLIGKAVNYKTSSFTVVPGSTFSGTAELGSGASGDITMTIKDQNGNVIRTLDVPSGADGDYDWSWDGKDSNGKVVPNGTYSVSASATGGSADVLLKGVVKRVDFLPTGDTSLVFTNNQTANVDQVASIDDAQIA